MELTLQSAVWHQQVRGQRRLRVCWGGCMVQNAGAYWAGYAYEFSGTF